MNKKWKVFWIVCAGIAVLGIGLCIAGGVLGATFGSVYADYDEYYDYSDHYDYDDKDGYDDYDNHDDYDDYDDHEGNWSGSKKQSTGNTAVVSGTAEKYEGVKELDLDISYLTVILKEYDGAGITVDTSQLREDLRDDLYLNQSGNSLQIVTKNKNNWKNLYNTGEETCLTINIPKDMAFKEVSLKVDAGVLEVEKITAGDLDIEVGAGQAIVDYFSAVTADADVGAGQIEMSGAVQEEISLNCGLGEISYCAAGIQDDYDYEVNCGLGDVTVGDQSYSGVNGRQEVIKGNAKSIEVECGVGAVMISFDKNL